MADFEPRAIGQTIDSLGLKVAMAADDMITNVVVLVKVVDRHGDVALVLASDVATTWLDQLGMIYAAADITRNAQAEPRGDPS